MSRGAPNLFGQAGSVPEDQISVPSVPGPNIGGLISAGASLLQQSSEQRQEALDRAELLRIKTNVSRAVEEARVEARDAAPGDMMGVLNKHLSPIKSEILGIQDDRLRVAVMEATEPTAIRAESVIRQMATAKAGVLERAAINESLEDHVAAASGRAMALGEIQMRLNEIENTALDGVGRALDAEAAAKVADSAKRGLIVSQIQFLSENGMAENASDLMDSDEGRSNLTASDRRVLGSGIEQGLNQQAQNMVQAIGQAIDLDLDDMVASGDTESIDGLMSEAGGVTSPFMKKNNVSSDDRVRAILQPRIKQQASRGLEGLKEYEFLKAALERNTTGEQTEIFTESMDEQMRRSTVRDVSDRIEADLVTDPTEANKKDAIGSVQRMLEIHKKDPRSPFGATVAEVDQIINRASAASAAGDSRASAIESFRSGMETEGVGQKTMDQLFDDGTLQQMSAAEIGVDPQSQDPQVQSDISLSMINSLADANLDLPTSMRERVMDDVLNIENTEAFERGIDTINQIRLSSISHNKPSYYSGSFPADVLSFVDEYNRLSTAGPISGQDAANLHAKHFPKSPAQQRNIQGLRTQEGSKLVDVATNTAIDLMANDQDPSIFVDETRIRGELADNRNLSSLVRNRAIALLSSNSEYTPEVAGGIVAKEMLKDGTRYTSFGKPHWMTDPPESVFPIYQGDASKAMDDFSAEMDGWLKAGMISIAGDPDLLPTFPETEVDPGVAFDLPGTVGPLSGSSRRKIVRDWVEERLVFTRNAFRAGEGNQPSYSAMYVDDEGRQHPVFATMNGVKTPMIWTPDLVNGVTASGINAQRQRVTDEKNRALNERRGLKQKLMDQLRDEGILGPRKFPPE